MTVLCHPKKGVSQAVAWVLLLGLSISLALVVGTWLSRITEDTGKEIVSDTLNDQRCADTVLVLKSQSCSSLYNTLFKNTGSFNITKVKCNGQSHFLTSDNSPLAPGQESISLSTCFDATLGVTGVVPFIFFDGLETACAGKSLSIRC